MMAATGRARVSALGSLVAIELEGDDAYSGRHKKISFMMDADQAHDLAHDLLNRITQALPDAGVGDV